MKIITLTVLIAMMVLCGVKYPPMESKAEMVKIESPLITLKNNELLIKYYEGCNNLKAEKLLGNLILIDSLSR